MAVLFDLDPAAIVDGVDGQLWSGTVNGRAWSSALPAYRPVYQASSDLNVPLLGFYGSDDPTALTSEDLASLEWTFHVVLWPLNVDPDNSYYGFLCKFSNISGRKTEFLLEQDAQSQVSAHAMMDFDEYPGITIPAFPFMTAVLLSFTSTGDVYKNGELVGQTAPEGSLGTAATVALEQQWGDTAVVRVLVSDSATVDLQQDMDALTSQYGITSGPPSSVSWSAPADGGSPITGFVVRFLVGGEVVEQEVAPEVLSVSVPEGATAVQVLAVNAIGFSTPVELAW